MKTLQERYHHNYTVTAQENPKEAVIEAFYLSLTHLKDFEKTVQFKTPSGGERRNLYVKNASNKAYLEKLYNFLKSINDTENMKKVADSLRTYYAKN